nr:2-hydroxymuconate tautomerase [uncultured Peptoniphilus sp.]
MLDRLLRIGYNKKKRRNTMPFIHVELVEGRSDEAKAEIAKEIIESVHKHAGAPKEHIHVVFQDMKRNDYFNEQ